jgi:hypothetical protein
MESQVVTHKYTRRPTTWDFKGRKERKETGKLEAVSVLPTGKEANVPGGRLSVLAKT